MRLEDKVAVITGGASGIGREASLLFAREGAAVVVVDVTDDAGRQTVDQIRSEGGRASYVHADVSSAQDSEAMVARAEREFGRLNVLSHVMGPDGKSLDLAKANGGMIIPVVYTDSLNIDDLSKALQDAVASIQPAVAD